MRGDRGHPGKLAKSYAEASRKDPDLNSVGGNVTTPDLPLDFELTDHTGAPYRLNEHLAMGPLVIMFNRGDW